MFFVASKVFWALAQPLSLIVILIGCGLILGWRGRARLALGINLVAFVTLVVLCFTNLGSLLIRPLENRFEREDLPETVAAIIVLGGATESTISGARGTAELNAAAERMTAALALARRYGSAPIVFSGGVGLLSGGGETEAATARRFFVEQGIDPERLILEQEARNTAENAQLVGALMDGDGMALLVTSAFHMPRSMGLFRKEGVAVQPWPVDYRAIPEGGLALDLGDPVDNLDVASTALREWAGLVAYRLTNRIDDLFPSPQDAQ